MDLSSSLDCKFPEDTVYLIYPSIHLFMQSFNENAPDRNDIGAVESLHWTRSDKIAFLRELAIHQWRQQEHVTAIPGIEATQCGP